MERSILALGLLAWLCGCGTEPGGAWGNNPPGVIQGSVVRPPGLLPLAQYTRAHGGAVVRASFVRRVSVEVQRTEHSDDSGLAIEQDYGVGEFRVTDALGETVPSTLRVMAPLGVERLVDAQDNVLARARPDPTTLSADHFYLPTSGEFVLFLGGEQQDGRRRLGWRTTVRDDVVDGVNTETGESVPLVSLAR